MAQHADEHITYSRLIHSDTDPSLTKETIPEQEIYGSLTPNVSPPGGGIKQRIRSRNIHWKAPSIMIGSLIMGVIFAVIQHVVFEHYNGRIVSSETEQTWIGRVGTGLAFAVKALLTTATAVAYIQVLMMSVRRRPTTVGSLDAMYGILDDPWDFLHVQTWITHPLLIVMSGITWLLPLASIVSPSALSPTSTLQGRSEMVQVPQLDFASFNKYANTEANDEETFQSAGILVSRVARASATQGEILSISAPFPNSSYALDFYGPGLSCQNVSSSEEQAWLFNHTASSGGNAPFIYISWAGANFNDSSSTAPLDYESDDSSKIYVVLQDFANSTFEVTQCALMNVSYSVDFEFQSNIQTLTINKEFMNGVPTNESTVNMTAEEVAYQSLMYISNQLLLGSIEESPIGGLVFSDGISVQLTDLGIMSPLCESLASEPSGEGNYQYFGDCQDSSFPAAIEELFQNMTISLLSNQNFQLNSSAAKFTQTEVLESQLVYRYNKLDLWAPYGTAIACTIVCVILGGYALLESGLSYSNSFSAIVLATRDKSFDEMVPIDNLGGQDPLPKDVARTKVIYVRDTGEGSGYRVQATNPRSAIS
ncbi:hypothetical protein F5884DRAFT_548026 [Xylogone sp. PMI_703]|nr:hypothetical protein F5884DRAFT_548026 [Xylogone sp. PMI_703]